MVTPMPTPNPKPELSEERIEATREHAAIDSACHYSPHQRERAQTTLALIESRKQALELLEELSEGLDDFDQFMRRVRAFLEQDQ